MTNTRELRGVRRTMWFTTSPYGRTARASTTGSRDGAALLHAKQLGTDLSACGQNTLTWVKYWEEFGIGPSEHACAECRRIVVAGSA